MTGQEEEETRELERLRWRSRRGLLETDVLLQRFVNRHLAGLEREERDCYAELLALDDNTLLDYVLGRKPVKLRWQGLIRRIGETDGMS